MKKRDEEIKKRDEVLNRKLKIFDVKSYTQTKIEEKCLAKNMRIPPLLKSKVGGRNNIKVIEESEDDKADDKELYRYLGLPVAYGDECEALAGFRGITLDEADYIDDMTKEPGEKVIKVLNILSYRVKNTESMAERIEEIAIRLTNGYKENIEILSEKWKEMFAIFDRASFDEKEKIVFNNVRDKEYYFANITEFNEEWKLLKKLHMKDKMWEKNLKSTKKLKNNLNKSHKTFSNTVNK